MWNLLLIGIIAYLLGSLPSAYLVTRLFTGQDIRYVGNGNVGTRNTMQVAGRAAGLLTLALDAGKGAAAYWAARRWGLGMAAVHLAGAMVVIGHWLPVWLRGRGGIGQAAATGFLSAMWPLPALAGLAAFGLGRLAAPSFDLAYGLGAAVFFAATFWRGNTLPGGAFIVLLLVGTAVKHLIDRPRQRAIEGGAHEPPAHAR